MHGEKCFRSSSLRRQLKNPKAIASSGSVFTLLLLDVNTRFCQRKCCNLDLSHKQLHRKNYSHDELLGCRRSFDRSFCLSRARSLQRRMRFWLSKILRSTASFDSKQVSYRKCSKIMTHRHRGVFFFHQNLILTWENSCRLASHSPFLQILGRCVLLSGRSGFQG